MNPLNAVALLFQIVENREPIFLGSCFAYCQRTHFLTANHCVLDREVATVFVVSPTDGRARKVSEILTHPSADVSLLIVDAQENDQVEPFWGCVGNYSLGEEFMAYGYPEDSLGPNVGQPTARLFMGYFQRFMNHKSHMSYEYMAGELSTPCPGGLSGGPLFRPRAQVMLTGLVAENLEVSTYLHEQEVVLHDGKVINEHYRRVVNYGVAVMLDSVSDWLKEHVPPYVHKG